MPALVKNYREQLNNLMTQFYLVLERYKQSFIVAEAQGDRERNQDFLNTKSLLETQFKNIFVLEQQVLRSIDDKNAEIKAMDAEVSSIKVSLSQEDQLLREKVGTGLAAEPLEKQVDQALISQYISLGYYVVATLFAINFAYKQYK